MKALKNAAVSEAEADAEDKKPPVGDTCLLPGDAFTAGVRWYVVYTNIKCETRAAEGLQAKGYLVFIPRYRTLVRSSRAGKMGRLKAVRRMAFPRYVLVGVRDGLGLFGVRGTDGVEALLCDGVVPAEVGRGVVEDLVFAVDTGLLDDAETRESTIGVHMAVGEHVSIAGGPFEGLRGEVEQSLRAEAVVRVTIFGGLTRARVPLDLLRIAG